MFDAFGVLAGNALAVAAFFVFPIRSRLALDRLERQPAMCFAAGALGWIAVIPIAVVLLCTLLLAPLIAVEALAVALATFVGTASVALLVGRRMYAALDKNGTTTENLALILGVALLSAAELVPILGFLVTIAAGLAGLGATILTWLPERALTRGPLREGLETLDERTRHRA